MTTTLDPTLLARVADENRARLLREDLEDALKEYGELDLLVELIQNALDAIDERRYRAICAEAGRDPYDKATIEAWNSAVLEALNEDHAAYLGSSEAIDRASYYRMASDDASRRQRWYEILGGHLSGDPTSLAIAAAKVRGPIRIVVRVGPPHWLEVEDAGIGISEIPSVFRHKTSGKRQTEDRPRRLGVRGSHGWGLTAVLALSDRLEVVSKVDGSEATAYAFSNYASFVQGSVAQPQNEQLDLTALPAGTDLAPSILQSGEVGTHVRVQIAGPEQTNVLGHTLENFKHEKFVNLLRLYTPIGQVNDYLLHPAYHNVRVNDLDVELTTIHNGTTLKTPVPFDFFRLSLLMPNHMEFDKYINAHSPRNKSVHTVHRCSRGNSIYLSAADIQVSDLVHELEANLEGSEELPQQVDELGKMVGEIQRGFQLALSGGMRSEYSARAPRSTSAAFRGIVLSETARPTLGRKHVVDQRAAIARAAVEHETTYNDIRKAVMPTAEPPPATPAAARWKRDYFIRARGDLESQVPPSESLNVWAGRESREARVMIAYGDLLARGVFGDMRILRAHLQDIYDFAFLYRVPLLAGSIPNSALAGTLATGGYVKIDGNPRVMSRYGIGEFKEKGEDVIDDFSSDDPRKMPDTPDLLVCWSFAKDEVEDASWIVELATPDTAEFEGQTHVWVPDRREVRRERGLAVIAIADLLETLVAAGTLAGAPPWPDTLPDVYY